MWKDVEMDWNANTVAIGSFRRTWKFISKGINVFLIHTSNEVGDGNRFKFWKDKWVGS